MMQAETMTRLPANRVAVALLLLAGLLLRLFFLRYHAFVSGDSLLYQEIAQNWIHAHTYGLSTNDAPRPTLIRLPGYPMVLAILAVLFDPLLNADLGTLRSFLPVLYLQVAVDLCTCLLLGSLAGRLFGPRARLAAIAMATLCPFTANYTAVPLTEVFTLFTIVLAFWAAQRWRDEPRTRWLLVTAAALSFGTLLRPDQGLLAAAVLPLLWRPGTRAWRPVLLCAALVALPFVPWTLRNARTFHVFQPIAPRLANDPGERVPRGFQRWYRTFGVDFASTEEAYWKFPEEPIDPADLPSRAFDSPAQQAETEALLHEAAAFSRLRPDIDARFARLADQRIHTSRLRYYVGLPVARVVNMLLRPRVEMLPVAERWWQWSAGAGQAALAYAFGALNLALLGAACVALPRALRMAPRLTAAVCAYMLLRCALLLTLDNAEQRYTLEFIPLWILLAASLFHPVASRDP